MHSLGFSVPAGSRISHAPSDVAWTTAGTRKLVLHDVGRENSAPKLNAKSFSGLQRSNFCIPSRVRPSKKFTYCNNSRLRFDWTWTCSLNTEVEKLKSFVEADELDVKVEVATRMEDINKQDWDSLVGEQGSPFLEYDWLWALEEGKCAAPAAGWSPNHVLIKDSKTDELLAASPMYVKMHSAGEFVFDQSWANAAMMAGYSYYPKLLVGVPFTPHTGQRVLTSPKAPRKALLAIMASTLISLCASNRMSSVHVNFCTDDEVEAFSDAGFLHRQGLQYHWKNKGYTDFDGYLSTYKSKKRINVRKERKAVEDDGISVTAIQDAFDDDTIEKMYQLYLSTVEKQWGRQYLTRRFFDIIGKTFARNICFMSAKSGETQIAGAINFQKAGVLYGRYWGAFKDVRHLHFEVCYYKGIEHCIEHGLTRMEPGAGGESQQQKFVRGFEPTATHSMHYFVLEPLREAVDRFLAQEREEVDLTIDYMKDRGPFKKSSPSPAAADDIKTADVIIAD